jgi:hypothetical protein
MRAPTSPNPSTNIGKHMSHHKFCSECGHNLQAKEVLHAPTFPSLPKRKRVLSEEDCRIAVRSVFETYPNATINMSAICVFSMQYLQTQAHEHDEHYTAIYDFVRGHRDEYKATRGRGYTQAPEYVKNDISKYRAWLRS